MLCRKIRKYYTVVDNRCNNLQSAISSVRDTQEVALSAPLEAGALLQTVPESGFVGLGIRSAEDQLNRWLEDADQDHEFRVIGVFGMGGIGKTSLLKSVYNTHLKGNVFEKVIWLTVSQKFDIQDLQKIIAEIISLDLRISSFNAESSSAVLEIRKMRLYNFLKKKKFLLILDDVWNQIHLEEELGIPCNNNGSRVAISTRSREVIRRMGANDYSIQIKPLSMEEGWDLFGRVAFNAGHAPTKIVEDIARKIAEECKGLPLAINVVAAAMRGNTSADEWNVALSQMKNVDPVLLSVYTNIDKDLIQPLKWSYDRLNDRDSEIDRNIQKCFLYCGAFAEDETIDVEELVEMWIGEGLVGSRDKSQLMETGRMYVKLLVERCLFEPISVDWMLTRRKEYIKVGPMGTWLQMKHLALMFDFHDRVMEDLPPDMQNMKNLQTFGLSRYHGINLPNCICDFERLEKLFLFHCDRLEELPPLERLPNLRVLRLWHLGKVRELGITGSVGGFSMLERLELWGMPVLESISSSSSSSNVVWTEDTMPNLQFLRIERCHSLKRLPVGIEKLCDLKDIEIEKDVWERSIQADHNIKISLEEKIKLL